MYEVGRVATYLPATQSSVYQGAYGAFDASLAVDRYPGVMPSGGLSCSVTNLETNAWWMVDLGVPLRVTQINFTGVGYSSESATFFSSSMCNDYFGGGVMIMY